MDQGEALDLEAKARPIGDAAAGQRPITQRQVMLIYFEQRLAKPICLLPLLQFAIGFPQAKRTSSTQDSAEDWCFSVP